MITVQVTLMSAQTGQSRSLGEVAISNTGDGTSSRGNYVATLQRPGGRVRLTHVKNFPRKQKSAFELLRQALNALYDAGQLP